MRKKFEEGGVGYGDIKLEISDKINESLKVMREKYNELSNNPDQVYKIIETGAEKANEVANAKLKEVKKKVGLST